MNQARRAIILASAALLLSACGGGKAAVRRAPAATATHASATAAAPTPPPLGAVPTLAPDLAATLKSYALALGDLPSGYSLGVQQELPNATASQGYADPAAVAKEIEQSGRQGGIAQQVFSATSGGELGVTIEAFKDAAGAQAWVAHPPPYPASMNATPATLPAPLGEQDAAIHWTQDGNSGYVINFRRGRFVFGLGLSAPAGTESLNALLPLAQALDAKAKKQTS